MAPFARVSLIAGAWMSLSILSLLTGSVGASDKRIGSDWKIDEKTSTIRFATKQRALVSCRGTFGEVAGSIAYDRVHPARSTVQARVRLSTLHSGITTRDRDLLSFRYLDAQKYPYAIFESRSIEKTDHGFLMHGNFELHGIRAPLNIQFSTPVISNGQLHVTGSTAVLQSHYALSLKPLHPDGIVWINDPIDIVLDITANRSAERKR
jgi:polyisoprenoid-binding protein YceI